MVMVDEVVVAAAAAVDVIAAERIHHQGNGHLAVEGSSDSPDAQTVHFPEVFQLTASLNCGADSLRTVSYLSLRPVPGLVELEGSEKDVESIS